MNPSITRALTRFSITVPLLIVVVSCSQLSYVNCDPHSWHGLGVRDGEKGESAKVANQYERRCSHHSMEFDRQAYEAGFAEGNAEYCSGQNGFHLGLSGIEAERVCKNDDAVRFKDGYRAGRALYRAIVNLEKAKHGSELYLFGSYSSLVRNYHVQRSLAIDQINPNDHATAWRQWEPRTKYHQAIGSDKQTQHLTGLVDLIAKCEDAKRRAEEKGLHTTLNCS